MRIASFFGLMESSPAAGLAADPTILDIRLSAAEATRAASGLAP